MRKKRNVARSSAASRKAWRTRERMKEARQEDRRLVIKLANDLLRQAVGFQHDTQPQR